MPLTKVTKPKRQREPSYENVGLILDLLITQRQIAKHLRHKRSGHANRRAEKELQLENEYEEAIRQVYLECQVRDNMYEEILWDLSHGLATSCNIQSDKMDVS